MLKSWKFFIIIYLIFSTIFNHSYKIVTKNMNSASTLTTLIQIISSIFCIVFIPFFGIKYPNNFKVYILLFLAIIFYTLNYRIGTISRSKLDASIYSVVKQLSTVFMILFGILFLKEKIMFNKIIGSILIIFSNILVLYKKSKLNKYILLGILANTCLSLAMIIDVSYSKKINLAFYILLISFIPSILIFIFERIKLKDLLYEYKNSNKISLFLTSISFVIMMLSKLMAYSLGSISIVAILSSLTVILTVIFGYVFLKEKDNLIKKIISSLLIILGILLIKL